MFFLSLRLLNQLKKNVFLCSNIICWQAGGLAGGRAGCHCKNRTLHPGTAARRRVCGRLLTITLRAAYPIPKKLLMRNVCDGQWAVLYCSFYKIVLVLGWLSVFRLTSFLSQIWDVIHTCWWNHNRRWRNNRWWRLTRWWNHNRWWRNNRWWRQNSWWRNWIYYCGPIIELRQKFIRSVIFFIVVIP